MAKQASTRERLVVLDMPRTRADCIDGPRPCPWIRCRHHLAAKLLPASRRLRLRVIAPGQDTCALDVAERGTHTLEEVGQLLGITRERVRQIEVRALVGLRGELEHLAGDEMSAREAYLSEKPGGAESMTLHLEHARNLDVG